MNGYIVQIVKCISPKHKMYLSKTTPAAPIDWAKKCCQKLFPMNKSLDRLDTDNSSCSSWVKRCCGNKVLLIKSLGLRNQTQTVVVEKKPVPNLSFSHQKSWPILPIQLGCEIFLVYPTMVPTRWLGCFAKSTFQPKIKGIASRIPPGYI